MRAGTAGMAIGPEREMLGVTWPCCVRLFWRTMLKCTSSVAERALARRSVRVPPA